MKPRKLNILKPTELFYELQFFFTDKSKKDWRKNQLHHQNARATEILKF